MIELRFNPLEVAMRQVIDAAVHRAVEDTLREYKGHRLDETAFRNELHRTARAAALNSCEQFKTFVNNELRMVELYWERRVELERLRPPAPYPLGGDTE